MKNKVDIHIFSPGKQISAQGVEREFTKSDLQQVVDSYKADVHEAPILIGHTMNDKVPSWGWVREVKMKGDDLYAEVEFVPQMTKFVEDGLYRKVSASFYSPESKINPDPGKWSLRHVAMLGGQPPAVKGLTGFAYSESDEHTFDFAAATGEVNLSPERVFDEELGPTLQVDQSPLEMLKEKLEEARQEMLEEQKRTEEANATLEQTDEEVTEAPRADSDFAEKKDMKKKAPAGKQGAEDAEEEISEEEADSTDNKEKKMDPVGKADGDIDNDGDEDSSDEYLKNRRAAIKKRIMGDKSDNAEDSLDHMGCGTPKQYMEKYEEKKHGEMKKYMEKYEGDHGELKKYVESEYMAMKDDAKHSEVTIPDGVDETQYVAGFKDAVDKFMTGVETGADEVVHEETEEQTADYMKGVEDGFEYAQIQLNRNLGSAKHDEKCCDIDEEADGEGSVASKVKKQNSGANETDGDDKKYGEPTFEADKKKRGTDNLNSSDVGVKETAPYAEDEDDSAHGEPDGRDEVGKADATGETGRGETAKAPEEDRKNKGSDGGAQEASRKKTAKGPEEDREKVGKAKDVQAVRGVEYKSLGAQHGSGKAIKSPAIRVMRVGKGVNHSEGHDFSELEARLAELEAANAQLVAEKMAAERATHRAHLTDFAESLFETGRLTPAVCDQEELVDYMEGLEYGTLEFAEGESAASKLMELLAALPAQVSYSEIAPHSTSELPEESLDPHERALRMSQENGMDYTEALKKTLFSAE